jgi:hypothetical protein
MWSLSASKMFRKCQRQWYYKSCLANAKAKDSLRHEAYLLSKLQSISSWRGNIVDTVISDVVIPALQRKRNPCLRSAQQRATELFERQLEFARRHPLHQPDFSISQAGSDFAAFHCIEYGGDLSEAEIEQAKAEINQALANLFGKTEILSELLKAQYLVSQRALSFSHTDESVRAVPDLVAFYRDKPPLIIDWKVHFFGVYKAWKQLGIYALALNRCNPHKDFPSLLQWKETDFRLWEVQLLTNQIRYYQLDEVQIAEIENFMAESISAMSLLLGDTKKRAMLDPEFLLTASSPETCRFCNYQSICWESAS